MTQCNGFELPFTTSLTHAGEDFVIVTLFLTNGDTTRRTASFKARQLGGPLRYQGAVEAAGGTMHVYKILS